VSTSWIAAYGVLAAGLVALALLFVGLLRRVAYVLEQAESHLGAVTEAGTATSAAGGLAPGSPVPAALATRADGGQFSTTELRGRGSIVLFLTSTCAPCKGLARELRRKGHRQLADLRVVAVVRDELERDALRLGGVEVVYQPDFALARTFETSASPHAFAVDANGTVVARSTPNTVSRLRELADAARSPSHPRPPTPAVVQTRS
jgi:thiol-disulfide isomerase/thioredoxin